MDAAEAGREPIAYPVRPLAVHSCLELPLRNATARPFRPVSATAARLVLVAGAAGLVACVSHPKVSGTWQDGAAHNRSYAAILVVGVSPDLKQRCAFERVLAKRLRSEKTLVAASCDAMQQKEPLTRENIEATVRELGADAVVATILVARRSDAKDGGSRDTRGGAYYKATDSGWATGYDSLYGAYGVPVIYADFTTSPSITTIKSSVQIQTRVFETKGATIVYKVDTSAKNLESRDEALATITAPIAEQLRRDGLIK
jgi:hypothetical protein